ncbi:hypothetical protein KSO_006920 [Bacillus amyloliquefaciens IT-45]|nr:hypothetical protein KSO_006920 [Bacillus amyloliquefaciens IT-45]AXS61581.1 hypothetical protein CK238_13235 [Bacillus velezensis]
MNATNKSFRFEKATVQQLMVIVRYEDCTPEVRNAALQMLIMKGVADVGTGRTKAFNGMAFAYRFLWQRFFKPPDR